MLVDLETIMSITSCVWRPQDNSRGSVSSLMRFDNKHLHMCHLLARLLVINKKSPQIKLSYQENERGKSFSKQSRVENKPNCNLIYLEISNEGKRTKKSLIKDYSD